MPKRTRRRRRSQSDILVNIVKAMSSPKKKDFSIQDISKRSKTTWRTSKQYVDSLKKAGIVKVVKEKGAKRRKYKLK